MGVFDKLLNAKLAQEEKTSLDKEDSTDIVAQLEKEASVSNEDFLSNLLDTISVIKLALEGKPVDVLPDEEIPGTLDHRPLLKKASEEIVSLRNQLKALTETDDIVDQAQRRGIKISAEKIKTMIKEGKGEDVRSIISSADNDVGNLDDTYQGTGQTARERFTDRILSI